LKEQRKSDRTTINLKPPGVLKLIIEDRVKDVQFIGDVSPFGIMVQLRYPVKNDTEVGLIYILDNANLETLGTVRWSRVFNETGEKDPSTCCQLGISFSPGNLKENLDFFNSLSG
jgi:hypothetical protein